jgi:molecular chaperone DnaJ
MKKRCLYEILGLETTSTQTEIRKNYKKLAFENHPDRNEGSEESTLLFQEIQHAYEILSDLQGKAPYSFEIKKKRKGMV